MKDELPLALVEEQAEGEVAAKKCSENGDGNGFDEPDRANVFLLGALRCGVACLAWAWGGALRGSVSTLALGSGAGSGRRTVRVDRGFNMEVRRFSWRSG